MSDLANCIASKASSLNGTNSMGTNVQVAVRCRPSNAEEKKTNQPTVITCDAENKTLKVSFGPAGKKISKNYTFDKVFGMYSTQEEVFESIVRPIVDEALAGFNCTIFAYGQTGTGKTHTMEGNINSEEHAGIVPRSVKAILEQLEASDSEYTIRVSFLELYNEELQDLLNTSGDRKLKLCEDVKKGVVCQNLEEITVLNVGDIFEILQKGIQQRQTAETLMNKNSSRSHSIFTMKIMIKECNVDGEEVVRHGQLNLVDLAGSECIGRSGAKNDRAREAGSINQSLLTLGRVITALVDHHGHIPYRDSKLTRLLQESLGGKAKTVIIATLSPSQLAVEETMSTLDYAHRAKNIKNQPTVNQRMTKKVVLKEYCAEIEMLKSQLQITREKNGVYVNPDDYYAMEARIQTQESQIIECEAALKCRNEELKSLRIDNVEMGEKCDTLEVSLKDAVESNDDLKKQLLAIQAELINTKTEWAASEAVVKEQTITEAHLVSQGKCLQGEVHGCRGDISSLHEKVSRFSDKEAVRVQLAAALVQEIQVHTGQLHKGISKMTEESTERSAVLCGGVEEMLTRGRETCATLKVSIDGALSTLIGDAEIARDCMTVSCDGLQSHLGETNSHVEATLKGLQANLSHWLGEVDLSMKQAQQLLCTQKTQLGGLSKSLDMQMQECSDLNSRFIVRMQSDFEIVKKDSTAFGKELEAMFLDFSKNVLLEVQFSKDKVLSRTGAIEEALKTMLRELVSETNESLSSTAKTATTFADQTGKVTERGLSVLSSSLTAANQHSVKHTSAVAVHVKSSSESQVSQVSVIENSRAAADTLLEGISGDIGNKRNTLDSTVSTLVTDVDMAVKKAHVAVQSTSDTANTILRDVVIATEAMTSSSSEALSAFESFIGKEGAAVQSSLGLHFESLDNHCASQIITVAAVEEQSHEYGEAASEKLAPTCSTPTKCTYRPLEDLVRTRNHDVIREQSRNPDLVEAALEGASESEEVEASLPVALEECYEPAPAADIVHTALEGNMEPARLSVLTITSSETENFTEETDNQENANPNKQSSLGSSASSVPYKTNASKITRITRAKAPKATM